MALGPVGTCKTATQEKHTYTPDGQPAPPDYRLHTCLPSITGGRNPRTHSHADPRCPSARRTRQVPLAYARQMAASMANHYAHIARGQNLLLPHLVHIPRRTLPWVRFGSSRHRLPTYPTFTTPPPPATATCLHIHTPDTTHCHHTGSHLPFTGYWRRTRPVTTAHGQHTVPRLGRTQLGPTRRTPYPISRTWEPQPQDPTDIPNLTQDRAQTCDHEPTDRPGRRRATVSAVHPATLFFRNYRPCPAWYTDTWDPRLRQATHTPCPLQD